MAITFDGTPDRLTFAQDPIPELSDEGKERNHRPHLKHERYDREAWRALLH